MSVSQIDIIVKKITQRGDALRNKNTCKLNKTVSLQGLAVGFSRVHIRFNLACLVVVK